MPIERHNWGYDFPFADNLTCVAIRNGGNDRTDANCRGCSAGIPRVIVNEISGGPCTIREWPGYKLVFDELWHTKYRPMAALCSLVEEADDSPA